MSNVIAALLAPCGVLHCPVRLFASLVSLTGISGIPGLGSRNAVQLTPVLVALVTAPIAIALFLRFKTGKQKHVLAFPEQKFRKTREVPKAPLGKAFSSWIAQHLSPLSRQYPLGAIEGKELEKTNCFIEKVADTLPSLLFVYDRIEKRHVYVNRAVTAILGYSDAEIFEMDAAALPSLIHPEDRGRVAEHSSRLSAISDGQALQIVYRMRHKNGAWRWFHGSETVFARNASGEVQQTIRTATDITEHQRTQKELQLLSSKLLSLHDEERRKLAFDLHEGTAQNLFAATLILRELKAASESRDRLDELIKECEALCSRSLKEIRASSYALYPPALQHLGLASTFRWYVDGFTKQTGIQVGLTVADKIERLPLEMEIDLFRVLQEGLSNVARHSGSRTATVRLGAESENLLLQIGDSGCGFAVGPDLPGQVDSNRKTGFGIFEMRQRLLHLGGSLEISSTNKGSMLLARIPIPSSSQTRTH